MKKIDITIDHLHEYMRYIREEIDLPKTSLHDYIKSHPSDFGLLEKERFTTRIKDIDFSEGKNRIDLSYANLSGTTLRDVNFSGRNVIIKGANLVGCKIKGDTRFTQMISLKGTNLGPIELDRNIFIRADLEEAIYDPDSSKDLMFPITKKQITDYLEYLKKNPGTNLNDYINTEYSHIYEDQHLNKDRHLIADLSYEVIDDRFSKADISGANLTGAIIKGEIHQLIMRDCITHHSLFAEECKLINPDLRGTNLSKNDFNYPTIINGKFSIDEKSRYLKSSVIYIEGEETLYDPCYNNHKPHTERTSIKCTKNDIADYNRKHKDGQSFISYLKENPSGRSNDDKEFIQRCNEDEIIADFSGQDLKGVRFKGVFKNCNFSGAKINGCDFSNSIMEDCNFSEVIQEKSYLESAWEYARYPRDPIIKMDCTTFKNCDFTDGDISYASGAGVTFENVTATNLIANNITLKTHINSDNQPQPSVITRSNFKGANWSNSKGDGLIIEDSNFIDANFTGFKNSSERSKAKIIRSSLDRANFECADLSNSEFKNNKTSKETSFKSTDINNTDFSQSQLHGDTGRNWRAFLTGYDKTKGNEATKFNNTDFQLDLHDESIGAINTTKAIESENAHKAMQLEAEEKIRKNKQKIYNRAGIAIIAGLAIASFAFPPLLAATVPAAIAIVATPIISSVIPTVMMAITAELAARNVTSSKNPTVGKWINKFKGYWNKITGQEENKYDDYQGPSLIRPVADLFGAKHVVAGLNFKPERDKKSHMDAIENIGQDIEMVRDNEIEIKDFSLEKDEILKEQARRLAEENAIKLAKEEAKRLAKEASKRKSTERWSKVKGMMTRGSKPEVEELELATTKNPMRTR